MLPETYGNDKIPKAYFLGASAAMYVFDISREDTYLDLSEKVANVKELSGLKDILIVGNKKDLVSEEELIAIKNKISVSIDCITSAKEGHHIEEAFYNLTTLALSN